MSDIRIVVSINGEEEWLINTKIIDEEIIKLRSEVGDKIITVEQFKRFFKLVLNEK